MSANILETKPKKTPLSTANNNTPVLLQVGIIALTLYPC